MPAVKQLRSNTKRRSGYAQRVSRLGNLYIQSLLDPRRGGAKIPDAFAARTSTVQLTQTVTVAAVNVSAAGTPQYACGGLLNISATPFYSTVVSSLIGGVPKPIWAGASYLDPNNAKLQSLFSSGRVVSSSIRAQFTGTTQNNQGTITLFTLNRTDLQRYATVQLAVPAVPSSIGNPSVTSVTNIPDFNGIGQEIVSDQLRALPSNAYGPVRSGGMARFFPMDNNDVEFKPFETVTDNNASGVIGMIGFYCEGLAVDASVIFEMVVNVEVTPRSDSFHLVSAFASPVDPVAMSVAQRTVARSAACIVADRPSYSMSYK